MSLRQMLKAVIELGLSKTDAKVYIFLATEAPQKATDIAKALRMKKQQLYPCLKNLQNRGVVNTTNGYPKLFSAAPIENVIDLLIRTNLEEAQTMDENRQEILAHWQRIIKKEHSLTKTKTPNNPHTTTPQQPINPEPNV